MLIPSTGWNTSTPPLHVPLLREWSSDEALLWYEIYLYLEEKGTPLIASKRPSLLQAIIRLVVQLSSLHIIM